MSTPSAPPDAPEYDPVYVHSFRESLVVLGLFVVFCCWSIGVNYGLGYAGPQEGAEPPAMIFGLPTWVFWGILVPWLVIDAVTIWFCYFFMADDDLGEAHEGEDLAEQVMQEDEHV